MLSRFDRLQIAEAERIVTHDDEGPVDALKRVIRVDWRLAIGKNDEKARARVLKTMGPIMAREAAQCRADLEWVWISKDYYSRLFAQAQKAGRAAPNFAHPDHVKVEGDKIVFVGPIDEELRGPWEVIKSAIQITEVMHAQARQRVQWDASPENTANLKSIEKNRRRLMRMVPKGWNWRERIFCRHSELELTDAIIADMKEEFDAERKTRDRVLARRKSKAITP